MGMTLLRSSAGVAIVALGIGSALAADPKLPASISWTAYGTTSSGYAQSVGLGKMLKEKYNADLRIIPGKNDVSRMVPLKAGQTPICACGRVGVLHWKSQRASAGARFTQPWLRTMPKEECQKAPCRA